jgi:AraC family transcriptional regulator
VDLQTPAVESRDQSRRILTVQDGEARPIYGTGSLGSSAPSETLVVERFDLQPLSWQSHLATDQLLMLFLKPTIMRYSEDGKPVNTVALTSGHVGFPSRWVPISVCSEGPISQLCVRIADSVLTEVAYSLMKNGRLEVTSPSLMDRRLASLLLALDAERDHGYPAGSLFIDGIELAVATILVRTFGVEPRPQAKALSGLGPVRLRHVLDFMQVNLDRPPNLRTLATCARLSPAQFSAQFRASTGMTPTRYMLRIRIDRAKQLLRNTRLSILEVGMSVGFDNQQHFATVFRRLVGVPPSLYRRHI